MVAEFDEKLFNTLIEKMIIYKNKKVEVHFKNGQKHYTNWLGKPSISKVRTFKSGELENHYNKHGQQVANAQNKSSYSIQQYLDDANNVIQNGTYTLR